MLRAALLVTAVAAGLAQDAAQFGNQLGMQADVGGGENLQDQRYERLAGADVVPRFAALRAQASIAASGSDGEGGSGSSGSGDNGGGGGSGSGSGSAAAAAAVNDAAAGAVAAAAAEAAAPPLNKHKGLEGRIKIAGDIYKVSCDCSKDALEKAAAEIGAVHKQATCKQPTRLHVFADRVSNPKAEVMSTAELEKHLPAPAGADIADVKKRTLDFTHKKESKPILGSLGGEIGEFVLAASVFTPMLGI